MVLILFFSTVRETAAARNKQANMQAIPRFREADSQTVRRSSSHAVMQKNSIA
jgi:hypothetical protein